MNTVRLNRKDRSFLNETYQGRIESMSDSTSEFIDALTFTADGLIPVIVQDHGTGVVLMLAWMNAHTISVTLQTKQATYWSRSRQEVWIKGLTSGNTQDVVSLSYDCDADALLMQVQQKGGACHTGEYSCFTQGRLNLQETES